MQLELFFNFNGNCREAVAFYAKVFKSQVNNLMTFGEAPPDPNYILSESDKERIMYASVAIGNMLVMFMDMPSSVPLIEGNNISPTLSLADKAEVTRLFNELSDGGTVLMSLRQTFFSEHYGMVKDKFGIIWQILHYVQK